MKSTILFLCSILAVTLCYAQTSTSEQVFTVKKPAPAASATFTYMGLPISPLALQPFLPGMEMDDTTRPWSVSLQGKLDTVDIDTSTDGYYRSWIDNGSQQDGYIMYKIVGKTADNKFVLDVWDNTGGNFSMPYIFVFKLVDSQIIKLAYFEAEPQYLNPTIVLKDDVIYTGSKAYRIPK